MFHTHAFPMCKQTQGNFLPPLGDRMCGTSAQVAGQRRNPAGIRQRASRVPGQKRRTVAHPALQVAGPTTHAWQTTRYRNPPPSRRRLCNNPIVLGVLHRGARASKVANAGVLVTSIGQANGRAPKSHFVAD